MKIADGMLTIRGEKQEVKEEGEQDYRVRERSFGSFSRAVELPQGVDPEDISAEIANGVLKVTVKKPTPKQSRQIEIKSAS